MTPIDKKASDVNKIFLDECRVFYDEARTFEMDDTLISMMRGI